MRANNPLVTHQITWKRNYHGHNSTPQVPILHHVNQIHSLSPCFFNIHLHILLQCMPRSSTWPIPFSFSNHNFVKIPHLSHIYYMPCPPHSRLIGHSNNIRQTVQIMKLLFISSFLRPPVFPYSYTLLRILSSHTLSFCSPLYVTGTKFHTHWTEQMKPEIYHH